MKREAFLHSFPPISLRTSFSMDSDEHERPGYLSFQPSEYFYEQAPDVFCVGLYVSEVDEWDNVITLGADLLQWVKLQDVHPISPKALNEKQKIEIPSFGSILFDLKKRRLSFPYEHTVIENLDPVEVSKQSEQQIDTKTTEQPTPTESYHGITWNQEGFVLLKLFFFSFVGSAIVLLCPCAYIRRRIRERKQRQYGRIGEAEGEGEEEEIEMSQTWSQEIPASAYEIGGSSDEEDSELDSLNDTTLDYEYTDVGTSESQQLVESNEKTEQDEIERAERLLNSVSDSEVDLT